MRNAFRVQTRPPPSSVFGDCSFLVALTSSRSSLLCAFIRCSLLFSLVLDKRGTLVHREPGLHALLNQKLFDFGLPTSAEFDLTVDGIDAA